MSGWDTSSTHTWGQQDGPDETQAFAAPGAGSRDFGEDFGSQEFGRMAPGSPPAGFPAAGGGYPGERSAANPPPEFYGQGYGQEPQGSGGYPQRTPGRSLHDMPQRDMRPAANDGGYGQDGGYGDNGYGQDGGYGRDAGFGQDGGYGRDAGFGQDGGYGRDAGFGQDGGHGQDWGAADQGDGWGGGSAGRSGAPWDDRGQRDAGYQNLDGGFGRQDPGRLGYAAQDYASQDYPAQDYAGQDYQGQDYQGQDRGPQEPSPYGRRDEAAARSDPALQDFFAPQAGYGQQPGVREPRFRQEDNGWGGWDGAADRPQPPRSGTGPRPVPRAARGGGDDDERRGLGTRGYVVIGLVVAVVIVLAFVVLNKGTGNKTPTAGNSPSGSATTSAPAKPSASAPGAAAATAYKLSTPTTAGGYAQGQDPHFLATATATAGQIVTAVKSGGGGTVKGNPVSAAYQLPLSQVITFVGYQGTFTPAKVATILATLGSDPHTYPAGTNGGMLGCANTQPSATATSGAVCVWATSSTLGITEFFDSTGPEALTTSQSKGAADTVKLRADVEAKA